MNRVLIFKFISLILFFSEPTWASSQILCKNIFVDQTFDHSEQSGFISLYQVSSAARKAQETAESEFPNQQKFLKNNPKVEVYFDGIVDGGLKSDLWVKDFLEGKRAAIKAISIFTQIGKQVVSQSNMPNKYLRVFKKIIGIEEPALQHLSSEQLLSLFSLFAHWNILPPKVWGQVLMSRIEEGMPVWTEKDVSDFALSRRLTPLELTGSFENSYTELVRTRFKKFSLETKMKVLATELIHGTYFPRLEIQMMISEISKGLYRSKADHHRHIDLKDLYRGLLVLRAVEPTQFSTSITQLDGAIEMHMRAKGHSLQEGGVSGFSGKVNYGREDFLFKTFLRRLEETFPGEEMVFEYLDGLKPGFFDPVDIYIPKLRIVVEWDGRHHYYKPMSSKGDLMGGVSNLVLRPVDGAKDRALRATGYRVLRHSKPMNQKLDELDIMAWLVSQNP